MKNWWEKLTPRTRQTVIRVGGAIIIVSMLTGNFDTIVSIFK